MSFKTILPGLFLPAAAALAPLPALAQQQGPARSGSWCPAFNWGGGWGGGFPMILVWIVLLLVLVVGIRWAVSGRGFHGGSGSVDRESALEVLKRRYAAGEIDRDRFQEIKKELGY